MDTIKSSNLKRVLVTGGAGFIGSHLVDSLIKSGHKVRVFDNLEPQVHGPKRRKPEYLSEAAKFIRGDVRDEESLRKALEGVEVVVHLAARVGVAQSMYQIRDYVETNTLGTANLLDALIREPKQVEKLIVASSMSGYGEGSYECKDCGVVYARMRTESQLESKDYDMYCPNCGELVYPIPTGEDKPFQPESVYAISKKDQEELCMAVGKAYGIPTVALRYFNVYGPRQSLSNPYTGVCAIFSSRIKNNQPPLVYEDGLQTRDFTSVHDIVRATQLVLKNSDTDYQIFNVGTGKPTSVLEIAQVLIKLYGKDLEPEIVGKARKGDIRHCYADISKIKSFGFSPKIDLEQGMKELVEWGIGAESRDKSANATDELEKKQLLK